VLGDSAYGSGQVRTTLRAADHHQTIKPIGSHASIQGGFTKDDFTIDLAARMVTCPAGQQVAINPSGEARFGSRCRSCPLRSRCTTATRGRTVLVYPWEAELQAARRQATHPGFQASYRRWRPMVERSIAWLVVGGNRRVRYHGWPAISCGWPTESRPSTCAQVSAQLVGSRVTPRGQVAGPGCQCGTSHLASAIQRGRLAPAAPTLRIGHLRGPPHSMTTPSPKATCSADSWA
jgi:hypothetical protein